jgi:hypothetical protein
VSLSIDKLVKMSNHFTAAIQDYRYLKQRGYPDKAALKLVADRYRLSAQARNCLFRGVIAPAVGRTRLQKLLNPEQLAGERLGVDWYNVLITLESYLKGAPVFIADDGVLRDSSGIHGSYRPGRITEAAIQALLEGLRSLDLAALDLYLDAPISYSGQMALLLRERTATWTENPEISIAVELSADYFLKRYAGVVATSDSTIMDSSEIRGVFDLVRFVLRIRYRHSPVRLEEIPLFKGSGTPPGPPEPPGG